MRLTHQRILALERIARVGLTYTPVNRYCVGSVQVNAMTAEALIEEGYVGLCWQNQQGTARSYEITSKGRQLLSEVLEVA